MPSDIRLNIGFRRNIKVQRLIRRLGPGAGLALVTLWLHAGEQYTDGILQGMTREDVELAAMWDGAPDAFVAALLELRLLDDNAGTLSLHDWAEHQPWVAKSKERSANSSKAALSRHHATRMRPACDPHADCNAGSAKSQCGNTETAMPLSFPFLSLPNQQQLAPRPQADAPPPEEIVLTFPTAGGQKEWHLTKAFVQELKELYPSVDIESQARHALGWIKTNSKKTARGMGAFLNRWMSKEQNRGSSNGNARNPQDAFKTGFNPKDYEGI